MAEITIPFHPEMVDAIFAGKKTFTSRTKRYGDVGDTFTLKRNGIIITCCLNFILRYGLLFVATNFYEKEGFDSPEQFLEYWNKLHPRRGYAPDQQVWVHIFGIRSVA